jgi:hypothetical protein
MRNDSCGPWRESAILGGRKRRASHCRPVQVFDLLPCILQPLADGIKVI